MGLSMQAWHCVSSCPVAVGELELFCPQNSTSEMFGPRFCCGSDCLMFWCSRTEMQTCSSRCRWEVQHYGTHGGAVPWGLQTCLLELSCAEGSCHCFPWGIISFPVWPLHLLTFRTFCEVHLPCEVDRKRCRMLGQMDFGSDPAGLTAFSVLLRQFDMG